MSKKLFYINKKGMTLIELVVSLTLLSIILIFLINLFIIVKNNYNSSVSRMNTKFIENKLITYINNDAFEFGINDIILKNSNTVILSYIRAENGLAFDKELTIDNTNKTVKYSCDTCTSKIKLTNISTKLPNKYSFNGFEIKKDEDSNTIDLILKGTYDGKSNNINIYVTKSSKNFSSNLLSQFIYNIVSGESDISTNVLEKTSNDASCTNTLAYDRTFDNNLRYVGKNPCNYVLFNGEKWRIIGVFNNIVNENKDAFARVKIIRSEPLLSTKWSDDNNNDWEKASLNTTLNTTFYSSLSASSKSMIEKSLWYLGGTDNESYASNKLYKQERNQESRFTRKSRLYSFIALPYPSDYAFAVGGAKRNDCLNTNVSQFTNNNCYTNDYLYTNKDYWFLTPNNGNKNTVFKTKSVASYVNSNSSYYVYPTLYLKANVLYSGGTGSFNKPYTINN